MLDEIVDYVKFLRLQVKVKCYNHPSRVRLEFIFLFGFFKKKKKLSVRFTKINTKILYMKYCSFN